MLMAVIRLMLLPNIDLSQKVLYVNMVHDVMEPFVKGSDV